MQQATNPYAASPEPFHALSRISAARFATLACRPILTTSIVAVLFLTTACGSSTSFPELLPAVCAVTVDKTYAYSPDNPVRVGGGIADGPARARAYLEHLRGPDGQAITYSRLGPLERNGALLNTYEVRYPAGANSEGGSGIVLYVDMSHVGSPQAPIGFTCVGRFPLAAVVPAAESRTAPLAPAVEFADGVSAVPEGHALFVEHWFHFEVSRGCGAELVTGYVPSYELSDDRLVGWLMPSRSPANRSRVLVGSGESDRDHYGTYVFSWLTAVDTLPYTVTADTVQLVLRAAEADGSLVVGIDDQTFHIPPGGTWTETPDAQHGGTLQDL